MVGFTRWCIARRRLIVVGWIVIAVLVNVLAIGVGRHYATDFSLPNTESQHVVDLLKAKFPEQSGDSDTIVFHNAKGTITAPDVEAAIKPLLAKVAKMPHVVGIRSPYSAPGAVQVSPDKHTAFATIDYSKRANLLPNDTGKPVLKAVDAINVPGLQVAAGGQVMEAAEGFGVGDATFVGVLAAMIILLITFGSLIAAGMPLITAGIGLVSGTALIGLATRITSMSNIAPEMAIMVGLGVGVDYALFIVTRFRENYARTQDLELSLIEAMDTSGRAILLAGSTVVIALLGMFVTGVSFMYGLSIAAVIAVLLTLAASMTLLPALLSRFGARVVRPSRRARRREARGAAPPASQWRRWSVMVQSHPLPLAALSLAVMVAFLVPFFSLRLDTSDAGNDPHSKDTYHAFQLTAQGFGAGFNGPFTIATEINGTGQKAAVKAIAATVAKTPGIVAVGQPRVSPDDKVVVFSAYPSSAPQASATTKLVHHLRDDVLPPLAKRYGVTTLVGGFTAGSIDFSNVLSSKLPLFIGIVVLLSALLLFVMFRSLVIPLQAGIMNLLSIGGALGATVAVFQWGWLSGPLGLDKGPVEPWVPVLMFAVVFGLSMDYEVFLISRVREEWVRTKDASTAVADGISFTGRVITAAAAIMICVFLSFMVGDERSIKEFGFGLAAAVLLDAIVVRCMLLPAVLELLGPVTWKLPKALDERLPHINIEGGTASEDAVGERPGAIA